METETFHQLVTALAAWLGAGQPLPSGNGVRFTSPRRGKATVYHADLATGNRAEIAFEPESMSKRCGIAESEFRGSIAAIRAATGRPVNTDAQFGWPRIGFSDPSHSKLLLDEFTKLLGPPSPPAAISR